MRKPTKPLVRYEVMVLGRRDVTPDRIVSASGTYMTVNHRGDLMICVGPASDYGAPRVATCFKTGSWLYASEVTPTNECD